MEKETPGGKVYPEQFARPFKTISEEVKMVAKLSVPRFGFSPRIANFKIVDACQMRCPHCRSYKSRGKVMTTPEVFKAEDNLARGGIQMLDLTGGETTLREDLPEIIEHSKNLGMLSVLNTNGGINRDYQYWHKLAEAGLFGATFSYDGIEEKDDKKVIHMASFLTNYLHIYGAVRMVVKKENLDKVYETGKECILSNVFFNVSPVFALDGETSAPPKDFTPLDYKERQELAKVLGELSGVRKPGNLLRTPNNYIKKIIDSPKMDSWHCKNLSRHLVAIDAQGRAKICGDRALKKTYYWTGDDNLIKNRQFHKDIEKEAENCGGCSWYCNWGASRGEIRNGLELMNVLLTTALLT